MMLRLPTISSSSAFARKIIATTSEGHAQQLGRSFVWPRGAAARHGRPRHRYLSTESNDTEHHFPPVTSFTPDETAIRDAARTWARSELQPHIIRDMEEQGAYHPAVLDSLFAQGFMGLQVPEEFGGSAVTSFTSTCLVVEELSRVDPSVGILCDIHNTLTINAIRAFGSPELQATWLPRLARDTISSFALSEAESGSDAFGGLRMTAELMEDDYVLNGTKLWISNAKHAGLFLVFAKVDPEGVLGYKGITAFLVDATTPGITVGPPERKLGLLASSTCPVHFDNVRADAVLGTVGQGYKYCIEILNEGRIGIAAQQLGIAKACLYDIALPYLHQRRQFGTLLADMPVIQHQYANAATELYAAETATYNACRLLAQPSSRSMLVQQASMAKVLASRVAERVASQTIEWLGGVGFTKDYMAEKFYRDCKVGSIYEGTTNIQLQTIAKQLQAEYK